MKRKLFAFCSSLLFVFGVLAAAPAVPLVAPVARAVACANSSIVNHHYGEAEDVAGWSAKGIIADITTPFGSAVPCGDDDSGILTWIAIEPGSGNPYYNSVNAILQIGRITCSSTSGGAACTNGERYFWAYGGCGLSEPTVRDLGAVPADVRDDAQSFRIQLRSDDRWYLGYYYNGWHDVISIHKDNSGIGCWMNDDKRAAVDVELWDDADWIAASGPSNKIRLDNVLLQAHVNDDWLPPTVFNSPCDFQGNWSGGYTHYCNVGSDYVADWSQ